MIELQVTQGSAAWHAARAKCFNASEAPAMQGVSPYKTRSALLAEKATGIVPEVDAATQARFDNGHAVEALARPLVEEIIGEELYPIVATDDTGRFLASSDGATMLCNIGFEHKALNKAIAAQVDEGKVPESHRAQLDHQFLVFGFDKIIFVCSDGTRENLHYCWYYPQPERIEALRAGWEQFEKDLAEYKHTAAAPAAVAETIEDLPALTVQLVGQVTASNLDAFKTVVTARIQAINTTLVTDNDFATADKMVKFLDDGEKRLDLVKSQALAQTESIDSLFRTIDALKAEMRSKRLTLDKLVKAEKESRKAEIVTAGMEEFRGHLDALQKRVSVGFTFPGPALGEAIKGLKSLDSMRDKVSVAVANAKIDANAIADRIDANRKTVEDMSLFPDFAQVCMKPADDFASLMAMRIGQRKEAEEKRMEAERERIRAEEHARAVAELNRAEQERKAAEAKTDIPVMEQKQELSEVSHIPDAGNMVKLGEICTRLGYTVGSDFLASIGFVATIDRGAKLYREADFPAICRRIADHTLALAFKKAV